MTTGAGEHRRRKRASEHGNSLIEGSAGRRLAAVRRTKALFYRGAGIADTDCRSQRWRASKKRQYPAIGGAGRIKVPKDTSETDAAQAGAATLRAGEGLKAESRQENAGEGMGVQPSEKPDAPGGL